MMIYNKITLSFSGKTETRFLQKYFNDSVQQFRIAFLLLIILYGSFGYLDTVMFPEFSVMFHVIRYAFVIPILITVYIISYTKVFQKIWQILLLFSFVAGGTGISIMTMVMPINYAYYAGLMLVFSAGYCLVKLRFFMATIGGWTTLLIFNIGAIFITHAPSITIINTNFFFISANLIGMFTAYYIEFQERKNYYLNQKLTNEQLIVKELNKNLERTIEERTREIIKAKEQAEESDRLKTAFLQNMSHEIRTPLNAISGFSGMLSKPDLTKEKQKNFVSIIQNSSKQLISIVFDILTISSIETRQEKANIDKVCINDIIVDLLSIFKQQTINQNISLYARQPLNDKQSEIFTDRTKITQILTNLLSNALKFTHEGSIEFGYDLKNDFLEFYVQDSGIGISTEVQEKIFERFRQADINISRKYGGTGLGLAISKAFAELLGGRIWVLSELGKGSTFFFTVPYNPVNETDRIISPSRQMESYHTILVAEDEEYNFLLIEELLMGMEVKLMHSKNGKEVIETVRSNIQIDLILMDIKMPVMDGHEAAKIVKSIRPEIPILAQSAYALEHERAQYDNIFDDYLTKPINEDELRQKVMKYINH